MSFKLSNQIQEIVIYAKEETMRTGCLITVPDHLTLGILRHKENSGCSALKDLRLSSTYLKLKVGDYLSKGESIPFDEGEKVTYSKEVQETLKLMFVEASKVGVRDPDAIFLLLAILQDSENYTTRLLLEMGITYNMVKNCIEPLSSENNNDEATNEEEEGDSLEINKAKNKREGGKKKSGSLLEDFGFDLTAAARGGDLDPVVGREKEIERVAQILGRRKKNNPILIGEPGVGKSAIAEGLAIKISQGNVSRNLLGKRIVSLDIGSIVAGTKFRGQFEERMKSIIKELKESREIILFIDEMHTLVGAGGAAGSLDAANLLKPALSRGEIQCIGATTLDEYREIIEKDGALERRFQKVMIEPTSFEETLYILESIKERYQKHHNVIYTEEALKSCITLSTRYISDRCLPDKAIDVMDEAGARAHLKKSKVPEEIQDLGERISTIKRDKLKAISENNFAFASLLRSYEKSHTETLDQAMEEWSQKMEKRPVRITPEQISEVMSMMTGIPLNKIALSEGNKLLSMDKSLKERVIGQDDAISKVVKAIQRNRAGLKDPNKPIGTFIFLGPTGVGKTQLAKVLAEYLFDSRDSLIRIDMSEYMEKFAVSRLIGAPPGYVGYEEGGQLSERVRRKPYSVVLLDEIEKAHPDIFNILLQVLDEGRLTDSNGRHIDFRNTVLIMTSNIGSRELKEFGVGIGYNTSTKKDSVGQNKLIMEKAINKTFNPEFLNRLDEQILFNPLTKGDIEKIIEIELKGVYERVKEAGYKLKLTSKAKKFVADLGYDPRYGARPLKRAIQKYVEDPVAEAIISGVATNNPDIYLDLNKEKDGLEITQIKLTKK